MLMSLSMDFIILIIAIIMMMLSTILSKKTFMDREKNSPFQCGFDPMNSCLLPFSLQFFLIAIIFLIFYVEIALLFPTIMIMKMSNVYLLFYSSMFFILILLKVIYNEWNHLSPINILNHMFSPLHTNTCTPF